jgi:signal recognition particle receptor subunit beta
MAWYDEDSWMTFVFDGHPLAILLTVLVAGLLPVLIHTFLYRKVVISQGPAFIIIGPTGAGKTSLATLVSLTREHSEVTNTFQVGNRRFESNAYFSNDTDH